mgnify:CR=1 FL=1
MIKTESLLYKIDQRLNKLSSNEHQQIQLEDKILALNEAQIKLIKQKVDPNNIYKLGLDAFKKRYEDLQNLVENYDDHPLTPVLTDVKLNKWTASIVGLVPTYMLYVDSYMIADKEECKNRVVYVDNDLTKHADVTTLIQNSNYIPSFEYQETFNMVSSDEIGVFTDGTFTPKIIYLSYIRYPQDIDYPGYVKFDGTNSTLSDCELQHYLEDELLDLTVENLAMYTENTSAAQNAQIRMQTNE